MNIQEHLKILKKRYPDKNEATLLFACYLHDKLELALQYKDKLEACSNNRDIAQIVVRPLYVNEEIDDVRAKNGGFIYSMLALTSFTKQGKVTSVRYHIAKMLDENEVKLERNIHIQSRLKLSQKTEQKENVPMVHTEISSSSSNEIVIVVPKEKTNAVRLVLQGMQTAGLITVKGSTPNKQQRTIVGKTTKITIAGNSSNIIMAMSELESYGVRKPQYVNTDARRRFRPYERAYRHRLPNSKIRVQIPGVNAGIGKLRNFTVPQGIKVLEAHSKLKGLDAAQIADIVFRGR